MFITWFCLYLSMLLLWTIQNTQGAKRHCGTKESVVNICSNSEALLTTTVFIETNSVPENQNTQCLCTISPSKPRVTVRMTYLKTPKNDFYMEFRLNDAVVLNKTTTACNATLSGKTKLISKTEKPHTNNLGVCLLLDAVDVSPFNITCEEKVIITTQSVTRSSTPSKTGGSDNDSISVAPLVAATGTVVCIAGLVALVVVCRRRSLADKEQSKTSTTVVRVEKEKEDEYYMIETPMYNATDAEPNLQRAEREYHYIEAEDQGCSMPDCQYESIPDSLVTGQFLDIRNNTELHRDYTSFVSSKLNGSMLTNKQGQPK